MSRSAKTVLWRSKVPGWVTIVGVTLFAAAMFTLWQLVHFTYGRHLPVAPCPSGLVTIEEKGRTYCATAGEKAMWLWETRLFWALFISSFAIEPVVVALKRMVR